MEAGTAKERIVGLDLMKVLGLYFVILYHLTFRNPSDVLHGGFLTVIPYALTTLMSICVPLFFTASGALALSRPIDLRKNTLRCLHLILLILFWVIVSLMIVFALRGEWPGLREFLQIASELRVGYIQHLWYLPTFLFLTLLTPVLYAMRSGPKRIYHYGLLLLFLFTFGNLFLNDLEYLLRWALGKTGHTGSRQFFWYVNFFGYHYWYSVFYLALGAYLVEYRQVFQRYRGAAVVAIPVCMVFLTLFALARSHVYGSVFDPVFNNYGNVFTLILTASVSLLLMGWEPKGLLRRGAASMASCSLGIYLIHWLLIEVLLDFAPDVVDAVALAPLTALGLLAISWGLSWCCLKLPYIKNLFTASPTWIHGKKSTKFSRPT